MPKDRPESISVDSQKVVCSGRIWDVLQHTFKFSEQTLVRDYVSHPCALAVLAYQAKQAKG